MYFQDELHEESSIDQDGLKNAEMDAQLDSLRIKLSMVMIFYNLQGVCFFFSLTFLHELYFNENFEGCKGNR